MIRFMMISGGKVLSHGSVQLQQGYARLIQLRALEEEDPPSPKVCWRWIWNLKFPFKCIILIWLASFDALPTNACRFKHEMAASESCVICNGGPEFLLHNLLDFPPSPVYLAAHGF